MNLYALVPYPGTSIRKRLLKEGLIIKGQEKNWLNYKANLTSNVCKLLDKKVEKWYQKLFTLYYALSFWTEKVGACMMPSRSNAYIYMISMFSESKIQKLIQKVKRTHGDIESRSIEEFMDFRDHVISDKKVEKEFIGFIKKHS